MENKTSLIIVVIAYLVLGLGMAQAQVITIGIEAVVDWMDDSGNFLEGKINVGDLITGSYTYDTSTLDTNASDAVGVYQYYSPPYGVSLNVGGFVFATNSSNVDFSMTMVDGNAGIDGYGFHSDDNLALSNGSIVDHISWSIQDYSEQAISSTALPTGAPVLANWLDVNGLSITGDKNTSYFTIGAHVTSVAVVPEPATIAMFALGLALVRRKNKAH